MSFTNDSFDYAIYEYCHKYNVKWKEMEFLRGCGNVCGK